MRIVLHRDIPDDLLLQQQWNALVQEMEHPEVFYTHQWALAVRRAYSESLLPMLILAYEGERLIGVAALAADPGRKIASFLSGATADYCDLLTHPDHRAKLLDAVLKELCRDGFSNIVLTSLPAESATRKALRAMSRKHGFHLFVRPTSECAQVDLGSELERLELKTSLGKKKLFRRRMNSLGREGPVSFSHLVTWEAIEPVLASFNVAHVTRFLAMGRKSNLIAAERRTFLSELARLLSGSGWLVLSRMLVADHPIAWNYGFQFQGSWFWYQPAFDASYERLSPGYCLLNRIIAEACDKGEMRVVDLGLGEEGYKERFANRSRPTMHASFTKSLDQHAREIVRYYAARGVRHVPGAESAVRSVLAYISCARRKIKEARIQGLAVRGVQWAAWLLNRCQEVVFYRWRDDQSARVHGVSLEGLRLQPVDLEILATAAMAYDKEEDTLSYLLHSARILQSKAGQSFALLDPDNTPVHFCWVGDFEGFEMKDLKTRLSAPNQNAAMISDCWTPLSKRDRGYFGIAISLLARHLSRAGKEPWIFSAITNPPSGRGIEIERAGFERRYSMICKTTLAWRRVSVVAFGEPRPAVEAQASSQA